MSLHIDGFEQFGGERNPTAALTRARYDATGTITPVASRRMTGLNIAAGGYVARTVPWQSNLFSTGCAVYFGHRQTLMILGFGDAGTVGLWMHPVDGQPRVNGAAGYSLPLLNRYYYFELQLNRTARTVTLFTNNFEEVSVPLTAEQAAATEVKVHLGRGSPHLFDPQHFDPEITTGQPVGATYDDFYIKDGPRYGPIEVFTRWATAHKEGDLEWYPFGGGPEEILGTLPPEETTQYVGTHEANKKEIFTSSQVISNQNAIRATGLVLLTRRAHDTNLALKGTIGGGTSGAQVREATVVPETKWMYDYLNWDTRAGDNKWTIEPAPFGFISTEE